MGGGGKVIISFLFYLEIRFLPSYLLFSQIWHNYFLDDRHFGCITKSLKETPCLVPKLPILLNVNEWLTLSQHSSCLSVLLWSHALPKGLDVSVTEWLIFIQPPLRPLCVPTKPGLLASAVAADTLPVAADTAMPCCGRLTGLRLSRDPTWREVAGPTVAPPVRGSPILAALCRVRERREREQKRRESEREREGRQKIFLRQKKKGRFGTLFAS